MSIPSARRLAAPILAASVGGGALCDGTSIGGGRALDDRALEAAARRVSAAQRVVAFTGAGVSAESGIRTYRDAVAGAGLWDGLAGQLGMLLFATPIGWLTLPTLAWRHYCERLLVPIHAPSRTRRTARSPSSTRCSATAAELPVITQNVDALHQRAGSRVVHELHGSVARTATRGPARPSRSRRCADPAAPPCWFARPDVVLFFESLGPAFWRAATLVDSSARATCCSSSARRARSRPRPAGVVRGALARLRRLRGQPRAPARRRAARRGRRRAARDDVRARTRADRPAPARGRAGEVRHALVARVRALRDTGRE